MTILVVPTVTASTMITRFRRRHKVRCHRELWNIMERAMLSPRGACQTQEKIPAQAKFEESPVSQEKNYIAFAPILR